MYRICYICICMVPMYLSINIKYMTTMCVTSYMTSYLTSVHCLAIPNLSLLIKKATIAMLCMTGILLLRNFRLNMGCSFTIIYLYKQPEKLKSMILDLKTWIPIV